MYTDLVTKTQFFGVNKEHVPLQKSQDSKPAKKNEKPKKKDKKKEDLQKKEDKKKKLEEKKIRANIENEINANLGKKTEL